MIFGYEIFDREVFQLHDTSNSEVSLKGKLKM